MYNRDWIFIMLNLKQNKIEHVYASNSQKWWENADTERSWTTVLQAQEVATRGYNNFLQLLKDEVEEKPQYNNVETEKRLERLFC